MRSPVLCSQEGRSYWKIRQHYLLCCWRVPTAQLAPQRRLIPGQWIRRRLGQSPAGRQGRLAWQKVISSFSDFKRNFHFEQVAARGVAPPMPVRYGQLGRHRDGGATLAGTRLPPPVNVMVQPGLSPDHMEVPTYWPNPNSLMVHCCLIQCCLIQCCGAGAHPESPHHFPAIAIDHWMGESK